jgi:alkyl hydroperoxide reductase subunit AhpF
MAIENPHITADVIEAAEFPHLAQTYRVMGVPKVIINENIEFVGMQPAQAFLSQVLKASQRPGSG